MPVNDKNKKVFSYSCVDRSGRKFIYKNLINHAAIKPIFPALYLTAPLLLEQNLNFAVFMKPK